MFSHHLSTFYLKNNFPFIGADLALLHLPRPSKHPTIRLPISPVDDQWYQSGTMATVAGWGSTSPHDTQQISQSLRSAAVKVCFNFSLI